MWTMVKGDVVRIQISLPFEASLSVIQSHGTEYSPTSYHHTYYIYDRLAI